MNLVEELKKEGRKEGQQEAIVSIARRMLTNGEEESFILECTGIIPEALESLKRECSQKGNP